MPVLGEIFCNNFVMASRPPAEAPMATIGNGCHRSIISSDLSLGGFSGREFTLLILLLGIGWTGDSLSGSDIFIFTGGLDLIFDNVLSEIWEMIPHFFTSVKEKSGLHFSF